MDMPKDDAETAKTAKTVEPGTTGATAATAATDVIDWDAAGTIPGLFRLRVARSAERVAYQQYDADRRAWTGVTWRQMSESVRRWQGALAAEDLAAGDRVAVLLGNAVEWVSFDLAALSLSLVVTPLYATDTAASHVRILADSGARLLLVDDAARWAALTSAAADSGDAASPGLSVRRVVCLRGMADRAADGTPDDARLCAVADWLPAAPGEWLGRDAAPDDLATLVYTSGTTGRPKGVMLSHRNLLWDAAAALRRIPARPDDVFLSILPLAHIFERIVGYYLPMMAGCRVAFARSVHTLPRDFREIRPTALLAVPRFYERAYMTLRSRAEKSRLGRWLLHWAEALGERRLAADRVRPPGAKAGRAWPPGVAARVAWPVLERLVVRKLAARFGGRIRVAVSGGGRIPPRVARGLTALGIPVVEGYGLTEAGAVAANAPEDNEIGSVGRPLPGVEVRVDDAGELRIRAPSVMQGYWNRPDETRRVLDRDGWLRTGDMAEIRDGRVYVRGRMDEILVTSLGENVSAAELEAAIQLDPLFDQVMVVGDGRPYLAAVVVLDPGGWRRLAREIGLDPGAAASLRTPAVADRILARLAGLLRDMPGHAQIRALHPTLAPWTAENGLLTTTMKPIRRRLAAHFSAEIDALYARRTVSPD